MGQADGVGRGIVVGAVGTNSASLSNGKRRPLLFWSDCRFPPSLRARFGMCLFARMLGGPFCGFEGAAAGMTSAAEVSGGQCELDWDDEYQELKGSGILGTAEKPGLWLFHASCFALGGRVSGKLDQDNSTQMG